MGSDLPPIRDERILEALEVCRGGTDDLSDPAMARLAAEMAADPRLRQARDRLARLDERLAESLADVPVPEGLRVRILNRMAAAKVEAAADTALEPQGKDETPAAEPPTPRSDGRRPVSRRWLLVVGGGSVAAAAALLALVIVNLPSTKPFSAEQVAERATQFFISVDAAPGRLVAESSPPDDFPAPKIGVFDSKRAPGIRWRQVDGLLGGRGVAYDLPGPGGGTAATLYVLRGVTAELPSRPPTWPDLLTANGAAGAWQSGELVYVLVARGGERAYRSCLKFDTGTLA
jgi:hypothetical protein